MHIGLIGGIGPAATDYYYRRLITDFAGSNRTLDLTIVHADAPTLLANLAAGRTEQQVAIYSRLADRLVLAGAACIAVTSIAGHFCIDEFKKISPLPVVDMIEATNRAISQLGFHKVGILGTRTVMKTRFYGAIKTAHIIPPDGDMLEKAHDAYAEMATAGTVNSAQRAVFGNACTALLEAGAQAIMLGGTDLALVYDEETAPFPIVDCAAIHCDALTALAFKD